MRNIFAPRPASWASLYANPASPEKPKPTLDDLREGFDPDKLTENEIETSNGQVYAKIPNIPGRIFQNGDSIELIYHRYYDSESRQTRNQKAVIGADISGFLPGMMMPNRTYYDYFDRKGNVIFEPLIHELEEQKRKAEEKERKKKEEQQLKEQQQEQQSSASPDNHQKDNSDSTTPRGIDDMTEEELLHLKEELKKERKEISEKTLGLFHQRAELDKYKTELDDYKKELDNLKAKKIVGLAEEDRRHIRLLLSILEGFEDTVKGQARRKPESTMSLKQIQTINEVLREIKTILTGYESEDYLHLGEEPDPEKFIPGTSYAEMAILLSTFRSVLCAYEDGSLRQKQTSQAG